MSVLRKSICLSITLSLILSSTHILAADTTSSTTNERRAKSTPYSYSPNSFCNKAEVMMEKLNTENEGNTKKVLELKEEIESAKSTMDILNGADALTKQYHYALQAIISAQSPKTKEDLEKDKLLALTNMKTVIRNGLIINAIGLLLKNADLNKEESFKIESICSKSENKSQPICKKETGEHHLDKMLDNFKKAYNRVENKDQAQLKTDVEAIIKSIPSNIAPSTILPILESASPVLFNLLASDGTKESIMKCLNENSNQASLDACEKLLRKDDKKQNIIEQMTTQTLSAISSIKKLSPIIEASSKANLASFGAEIKAAVPRESDKANLQVMELIFYESDKKNVSSPGEFKDKDKKAINAAKTKAAEFEAECLNPNNIINIQACQAKMQSINHKVMAEKTKYKGRLSDLQNEMKKIDSDNNGQYTKIETLKKFVAEKYLRTCKNNPSVSMIRENVELGIAVDGTCYSGTLNLGKIDSLVKDAENVILKTQYALDISAKTASSGTFNKKEMNEFSSVCKLEDYKKNYAEICSEIGDVEAVNKREQVKENKWNELNDKYWVSYDAKSPKGYSQVQKKSNLRIFGEGVLPVVPTLIPMFFANYAMGQNISMLTNQALYQKQMLHSYDVYNSSPWMFNYNYFGSSSFNNTAPASPGFNFTP